MNYKNLLNPPVQEAQKVWSFKENKFVDAIYPSNLEFYSCIWDETEEFEPNPVFWFASETDCFTFLRNTPKEEVRELLDSESYYK